MKLHLPKGLRAALIAAFACVSCTLASATELNTVATMQDMVDNAGINTATVSTSWEMSGDLVYSFSGSNSFLGNITTDALTSVMSDLNTNYVTVAAWVNPSVASVSGDGCAVFSYGAQNDGAKLIIHNSGNLKFTTKGKADFATSTGATVPQNDWTLVAVTFHQNGGNFDVHYYINGAESTASATAAAAPTADWAIGNGNGGNEREPFKGDIGGFTVFSSTDWATATDITSAMGLKPTKLIPPGYTWTGSVNGNWDTSTLNWVDDDGAAVAYTSSATANTIFNATPTRKAVTVKEGMETGSMSVTADGYTFALEGGVSLTVGTLDYSAATSLGFSGNGTVVVNTLEYGGALTIADEDTRVSVTALLEVATGKSFATSGAGTLELATMRSKGGAINISSNLTVNGGGDGKGGNNQNGLCINGGTGGSINILGGVTTVTGAVYTGNGSQQTAINVGTGDENATLVTRRLELGDTNGSTCAFTIGEKGKVVITGDEDFRSDTNNPQKKTSLQLAEWNQVVTSTISGKLYAENATAFMSNDASSTVNITGGTMAVKGIATTSATSTRAHTFTMDGGKLILGDMGFAQEPGEWTISFANGEIGTYAGSTVVGRNFTTSGNLTFNTAMYTWTGDADSKEIEAGEAGATITVSGNITGDGTIIKTGDGTLMLSGDNNALTHTINLQKGTLDVTTAVLDISNMDGITTKEYSDGQVTGNGFATRGGTVHVVAVGEGAILSHEGAQVTFEGTDVTMDDNGDVTLEDAKSLATFYVNVDGSTESLANAVTKGGGELTTVNLGDNTKLAADQAADLGTLMVRAGASADVELSKDVAFETLTVTTKDEVLTLTGAGTLSAGVLNGPGTISIGDDAVLSVTTATVGIAKPVVTGGGTLAIANGALTAELAEAWTGTVRVANTTKQDGNNAWIDTLANENSWVEFVHFKGYDRAWASTFVPEVAANIKLTSDGANAAWELSAFASSTYTMVATGDWKGDGTFLMAGGSAGQSQAVEYKGDITNWTGSIEASAPGMRRVTFSENATNVNVSLVHNGTGAFELVVNNAATFSKGVNVSKLTVDADKSATFQADTTVGQLAGSGSIVKTGTDTTMTVTAPTGTGTTAAMLDISVNEGTLKATAATALGSGPITVADGAVLDLVNGGALGTLQTVNNSGNVIIHNTLTAGSVTGGTLTLASDFPSDGDLEDVGGLTDTGNGFNLGGVMHVYDTEHATLTSITDIVSGDTHYTLDDLDENGDLSMSGADWTTYQLNGETENTVQAIMDYADTKGGASGTLKNIVVSGEGLDLVVDVTADAAQQFKTSMLGGDQLASLGLTLVDQGVLVMDADLTGNLSLGGLTEDASATVVLEKDVAAQKSLWLYNMEGGGISTLTIKGAHTLTTPLLGTMFGKFVLQEGATLAVADGGFGINAGDSIEIQDAAELNLGSVSVKSVDGAKAATMMNESDEDAYDIGSTRYSLTDARVTISFSDAAHNFGHELKGTSALVNAGTSSVNDTNALNIAYDELHAQNGNIYLSGKDSVSVHDLTVGDGLTVGGTTAPLSITVTGEASFGSGSTVSSALTMAGGSTLDADGPVALGTNALSLAGGVNMGEDLWSTLTALAPQASTNIFTGVSALTLAGAEYTDEVDLSDIFAHDDLKSKRFTLSYDGSNVIVTKNLENNRYWKGGDGTWNTTSTVWTDEDGAGTDVPFVSGYNAHFTAANGGTVTLGEDITAASVYVSGADYTFAPNGHTLTVTKSVEADGHKATFNMALNGDNLKLVAKGGGTITLNNGGSVKDVEVATDGTIRTSGTLTVADGFTNAGKLVQADTLTIQKGTATGGNVTAVAALNLTSGQTYAFGDLKAGAVNGTGANLTIGAGNTLTVNGDSTLANLTLGNGATVAGSSTMNTAGVTLQGDATVTGKLAVSGMIAGTGCTLKIENGELSAAMLSSGVGLVTSGTTTITSTGVTLALKDTVDNASDGTVTFVGNFEVGHCDTVDGTATYVGGGSTANGFKQAQKIVSVIDEGTAVGTAANLTYNGKAIGQMNASGKVTFQGDTEYDKFYVNSGSENASTALDNPNQRLGTFELKAGTTLVADRDIDISRVNAESAATLDIAAGTTVTSAGQSKTLTLKGAGTFALNSGVSTPGVALDSAWAGTVSFTEVALTTLKGSWKSGSTVSLTGVTGSLGNDLIEATVVLNKGTGDWGFGQTETSGTQYTNLEGTLTGDGNLGVKGGSVSSTFNLDGNIDGWTGNFIVATDADTDLNLNGTAKTVHGSVSGSNLTVNVNADTTFEGALNVDVINVDNTKAATLKADSTARWVDAYNGTLKVNDGKTLTVTDTAGPEGLKLGAGARIVLPGAAYLGGEDYGYVGGTVANGTSGEQAVTIDNANITVTGTTLRVNGGPGFTVDNKLVNATLAVENGLPSTVTLNNVQDSLEVAGDLEIGPGGSLKVANGGSKQELVIGGGTTLTLANDTTLDADLTLNRGATLKLDYNMGSPVATTLNGGGLTLYKGLTLSGDLFETLKGLTTEGEFVTLFSNVGTVVFDGATTTTVDASTYFTNLLDLEGDYTFNYDEGLLSIVYSESSSRQLVWDGTETEHRWVAYEPETIAPEVKDWYQPSTETETHFVQGDTATFGSDADVKVVNLSAGETVAKMVTIKEAADYEFVADAAGSKLSATRFEVKEGATLNKSGAGTLILEVGENVTVDAAGLFVDEGELVIGTAEMPGTLAFDNGVMEVAEGATLRVAKIQDSEGSLIAVCGTLNVASGSLHAIHALEGSTLVISNVNGVAAGTLSIGSDTTLHGLDNHGTLDVGTHSLTLAEAAAQGGNVTAGTLNLAENGNSFGNLKVNTIHYAYGAEGAGELGAVNVDTIAANGGFPVITLDLADTMGTGGSLAPTQRTGEATTHTLIHADGQTLSTSNFMLGGNTLALLVQNGLIHEGAGLETDGTNITLTVGGQDVTWNTDKDVTEWGYTVVSNDRITAGGDTFNGVEHLVVDASRRIDVTGAGSAPGLRVRNITGLDGRTITFTGTEDDTVNLVTNEETASNVNVAAENITLKVGLDELDEMDPVDYKDLRVGNVNLTSATLDVHAHEGLDDSFTVNSLNGDSASQLKGTLIVEGQGGAYNGGYEDATVILHENADQALAAGRGLTVMGLGLARITYSGTETHMDGIEGIGLSVMLNDAGTDNSHRTLTLDNEHSYIVNGALGVGLSAIESGITLDSAEAPDLLRAEHLDMSGSTLYIYQAGDEGTRVMDVNDGGYKRGLLLAMLGADDTTADAVQLQGNLFFKYYQNPRLENGRVLVDRRTDYFTRVTEPTSENGQAGAGMLDDALLHNNPQATQQGGDLATVMSALEQGGYSHAYADKVMAAMSGASQAAMGAAWNRDVDRQLRAIRNRTTQMGLAECTRHEGLPYFNAWINAEGDYTKLSSDGTLAGYKLTSWGGTLGVDVDCTSRFTMGVAVTAMSGDFTADSAERAEGDLDRLYVSVFGRYTRRAWTHTFVATLGMADTKLERTVDYGYGSYNADSSSDGKAFGLMYEVGYVTALNEDSSTCLQPVLNLSYRHSSLAGCGEQSASDAALRLGNADANVFTAAIGARLQSAVGTSVYNRTSIFEGRVMLKFDTGDRDVAANNSFVGVPGGRDAKSTEAGLFGVEVGAGLTIPLSENAGAIFFDVSGDFRAKDTEVNGTVGYRYNF